MCLMCNKKLIIIGLNRVNGKDDIKDWIKRRYHKKCYKIYCDDIWLKHIMKESLKASKPLI